MIILCGRNGLPYPPIHTHMYTRKHLDLYSSVIFYIQRYGELHFGGHPNQRVPHEGESKRYN